MYSHCCYLNFSLIKEYRHRPKYKKLLEYAFIKKYETANVDVASWFHGKPFKLCTYSYYILVWMFNNDNIHQ